ESSKKPAFDKFTLILIWVAGADHHLLLRCPTRDVHSVKVIGAMLLVIALWQTVWLSLAGHLVFAPGPGLQPGLIAGAILPAVLIMLFDSHALVKPSWLAHGLADLERHGLKAADNPRGWMQNNILLCGRLLLSIVVAQIIATVVTVFIFAKDID